MTGETISELLKPLVGKSGTIFMVVHQTGQVGFTTAENKKLTGVELRPDGLVRLEREAGWAAGERVGYLKTSAGTATDKQGHSIHFITPGQQRVFDLNQKVEGPDLTGMRVSRKHQIHAGGCRLLRFEWRM